MNKYPLEQENGDFVYSAFGPTWAFMFRGDDGFRERGYNLVNNFGPREKKFYRYDAWSNYFTLHEQQCLRIIALYYRGQLILDGAPAGKQTNVLARHKARQFWDNRVEKKSIFDYNVIQPDWYSLGYIKSIDRQHKQPS